MRIGLVRHGEAEASGADEGRALTARGRAQVDAVARAASSAGVRIERIRHSGKRRAVETAEILAARFGCPVAGEAVDLLRPGAPPLDAARWIESLREPELLVSHLPLVERLAATLLSGSPEGGALPFTPATLLWLESGEKVWRVVAHLAPETLSR